jgi:putative transposase
LNYFIGLPQNSDGNEFDTRSWLVWRLTLFDLADFKYRRFALINEDDRYFQWNETVYKSISHDGFREWCNRTTHAGRSSVQRREDIDVKIKAAFNRWR